MKGEFRLGQAQLRGELTDTALTAAEGLNHLQADRVRQGPEQGPGVIGREGFSLRKGSRGWGNDNAHVTCNTQPINCS